MSKDTAISSMDLGSTVDVGRAENAVQKANNLKGRGVNSKKDIEKAAGGFEALMLHEMLKSMWATVQPSGLFGENSFQEGMYRDMFHQAISDTAAKGRGIGIKQFLTKEIDRLQPASKVK